MHVARSGLAHPYDLLRFAPICNSMTGTEFFFEFVRVLDLSAARVWGLSPQKIFLISWLAYVVASSS
jgi:hypothetical protein